MKFIQTDICKTITTAILITVLTISSASAYASPQEIDNSTFKTGKELYLHYIDKIVNGRGYDFYPDLDLLVQSIMEIESHFQPNLVSSAGCVGLMQVSPYWHAQRAAKLGVRDLFDPYGNILVAVDLIKDLYFNYADQDMILTVMMYNMPFQRARQMLYEEKTVSIYARDVFRTFKQLKGET